MKKRVLKNIAFALALLLLCLATSCGVFRSNPTHVKRTTNPFSTTSTTVDPWRDDDPIVQDEKTTTTTTTVKPDPDPDPDPEPDQSTTTTTTTVKPDPDPDPDPDPEPDTDLDVDDEDKDGDNYGGYIPIP